MEKPLLVSGTLIDPIKNGIKTQTRRLTGLDTINQDPDRYKFLTMVLEEPTGEYYALFIDPTTHVSYTIKSPYGDTGTVLWVRENYYFSICADHVKPRDMPPGDHIGFMADGPKPGWGGKTRPGIHLPRAYCRILLNVEEVYSQRLWDLSEEDARCEGVNEACQELFGKSSFYYGFQNVWIHLNGRESWENNPWVWVVKFNLKTP